VVEDGTRGTWVKGGSQLPLTTDGTLPRRGSRGCSGGPMPGKDSRGPAVPAAGERQRGVSQVQTMSSRGGRERHKTGPMQTGGGGGARVQKTPLRDMRHRGWCRGRKRVGSHGQVERGVRRLRRTDAAPAGGAPVRSVRGDATSTTGGEENHAVRLAEHPGRTMAVRGSGCVHRNRPEVAPGEAVGGKGHGHDGGGETLAGAGGMGDRGHEAGSAARGDRGMHTPQGRFRGQPDPMVSLAGRSGGTVAPEGERAAS
jgi:hypothetical protein